MCLSAGGNYLFPGVYTHRLENTWVFSLILSNKKETNIGARQMLMFSWVRQTQDSDVYHWSSSSFQRCWYARVGAAIIRQRARIGMAAASRDRKHIERTTGLGSYAP